MKGKFYPTVDYSFIENKIRNAMPNVEIVKFGKTTAFVKKGTTAIHKRIYYVKEMTEGNVNYEQAVWVADKFNFLKDLHKWLKNNKNWTEEAFIKPK